MSITLRALEKGLLLSGVRNWLVTSKKLDQWAAHPRKPYAGRPPALVRRKIEVTRSDIDGWPVYEVIPRLPEGEAANGHLIFLHGGGYVLDLLPMHWLFIAKVARDLRRTVTVPIYPLTPEHTYRDVYPLLLSVYRRVLDTHDAKSVAFMGESAGGGLALGLCHAARDAGLPQPRSIVLLSPWLHAGLPSPEVAEIAKIDPILSLDRMREAAEWYAGGDPLDNPLLSPSIGPLDGLPHIAVVTGTHDLLNPDARAFRRRTLAEGIEIGWYEQDGGIHGWLSREAWRYVRSVAS